MSTISRRHFLASSATAMAGLALAGCRPGQARRPNVVFVLTDDQRWDAMSVAGHPFLKTPHMDRLAAEGARFRNAFVPTSICSPSRASFLSGVYPHVHGVRDNFTDYPATLPSYHSALKKAGYQTAYIGKWHMGEKDDSHRAPFDYWASHSGQGHYEDTEFNLSRQTIDSTEFQVQGKRQLLKGYYTHVVNDLAVEWLKTARRPFSLQLGHKAPHGKWLPEPKYAHVFDGIEVVKPDTRSLLPPGTPDWVSRRVATWHGIDGPLYETFDFPTFIRTYHATIPSVDDSVGEIYETLRAMGELDNTIFVFAGDNGFLLGEHASIDKRTAWEESIRIPLLIRYPDAIPAARVVDEMVLNMDLAPTLLELTGTDPVPGMQGRSTLPLVAGRTDGWRQSWLYQYNFEKEFPYTPNVRAVRTADWKYIHYPNGEGLPDTERAELYDLAADPKEQRNLIADPAAQPKLAELRAELRRLQQESGALPDQMPLNPQLRYEMPESSIR